MGSLAMGTLQPRLTRSATPSSGPIANGHGNQYPSSIFRFHDGLNEFAKFYMMKLGEESLSVLIES